LRAPHILLVDDEPGIQTLLADVLRELGYAVDLAATIREAKTRLIAQSYDLVVADWRLPDGDGTVIADWAAELSAKTLLVSGYLSYMQGGRAADHETLSKPLRLDDFIAVVKRAIGEAVPE
jgi:two-component system response regulator HydG